MDKLKVTDCSVYVHGDPKKRLKGEARVSINNMLELTGLQIYEADDLFVSYPNDPDYKDDDYRQIFYPTSMILRHDIKEAVLEEYHKELKRKENM